MPPSPASIESNELFECVGVVPVKLAAESDGCAAPAGWFWWWEAIPGWRARWAPGCICAAAGEPGSGRDRVGW